MCQTAYIDGTEVSTLGEIRRMLGTVVTRDGYVQPLTAEHCLCPVNMERTAGVNGRSLWCDYSMTNYLTTEGQRYVMDCLTCGETFDVREKDAHWDEHHQGKSGYARFSGPRLVGGEP